VNRDDPISPDSGGTNEILYCFSFKRLLMSDCGEFGFSSVRS